MPKQNSVRYALDKDTGEIIDSTNWFDNNKLGHKFRTEYNRELHSPFCLECDNKLTLSTSKKNKVFFKHFPNSPYCTLKDLDLSPEEKELFLQNLISKESERHIHLKNTIGNLLNKTNNVKNVFIDNKILNNSKGEKRKPDILFEFKDIMVVFEIQLSQLSQKYILSRHDFYKEKGIYLIWILDNFDSIGKSQMEKDIKYLSEHHNYFRFHDSSSYFQLNCRYKQTSISKETNEILYDWYEKNITLDNLKFNKEKTEVYFHNFLEEKEKQIILQKERQIQIDKKLAQKKIEKEQTRIAYKVDEFLNKIAKEKINLNSNFHNLKVSLRKFSEEELSILNQRLNLKKTNRLHRWIKEAESYDEDFLEFIITTKEIDLDINIVDKNGLSLFQHIYMNQNLNPKEDFVKLLFLRGYKFNEIPKSIIETNFKNTNKADISRISLIYTLANKLNTKNLLGTLFIPESQSVLCTIESLLQNKIIGYNFNNLIMLMNNAIQHYPHHWSYIQCILIKLNMMEQVIQEDEKGTFQKKLKEWKRRKIPQDIFFGQVFQKIYPEFITM